MKAVITGESERVGVKVQDNNGVDHGIEMEFDGEIKYHEQEGYPDKPSNRTEAGNEHVNQARRYAKYYVFQERGYETVAHAENPTYIEAVRGALVELSDEEFKQYFGALHQQLRSHHDEDVERLVGHPPGAQAKDAVVYELDVYLGVDTDDEAIAETLSQVSEEHGLSLEAGHQPVTDASESDLADWEAVGEDLLDRTDKEVPLTISAVSGIHVGYPNAAGEHEVQEADDPLSREADTRIELLPGDPGSLSAFRQRLDHHLRCQVRDCLVGMGVLPPEPFQTVGFGKSMYARRYDHYEMYPPLHMADEDEEIRLFG